MNQKALLAYAENSHSVIEELDRWGVEFQKNETGEFDVEKVHHNGNYVLPMPEGYDPAAARSAVADSGSGMDTARHFYSSCRPNRAWCSRGAAVHGPGQRAGANQQAQSGVRGAADAQLAL